MVNRPCESSIPVVCPSLSILYLNIDTCKNPDNTATSQPKKRCPEIGRVGHNKRGNQCPEAETQLLLGKGLCRDIKAQNMQKLGYYCTPLE